MIVRKSQMEIERMYASGQLVARVLAAVRAMVRPGVTTMDLEEKAVSMIDEAGASAAFKGYYVPAARKKFPAALCTSVNDEVVHGIPSRKRVPAGQPFWGTPARPLKDIKKQRGYIHRLPRMATEIANLRAELDALKAKLDE